MSTISLFPFLIIKGSIPVGSYDPTGMVIFFSLISSLSIILFFVSVKMVEKKVLEEKNWKDQLSFHLNGYPDFFIYRSYSSFEVSIHFKDHAPEQNYLMNILGTLPLEMGEDEYQKEDEIVDDNNAKVFKFQVQNPRGSKFNRHRRWARRWLHKACDIQFPAIHKEYPINLIQIGDGASHFDFDWSIPRKRMWWFNL